MNDLDPYKWYDFMIFYDFVKVDVEPKLEPVEQNISQPIEDPEIKADPLEDNSSIEVEDHSLNQDFLKVGVR